MASGRIQDRIPTEHEEAVLFADWLRLKHLIFAHIPNETYTTSWNQKRKNKQEGVSPGVPDYMILLTGELTRDGERKLLFVELKRKKGIRGGKISRVSDDQEFWILNLSTVSGVDAEICYGFDEAKSFVEAHLK